MQAFCLEVVRQLEELLRVERINLASPLEWRVKTWASVVDKLRRGEAQPGSLSEVADLAGIRIIALFRRDVSPIEQIIEKNFRVLHKEDTFSRLGENEFGYGSIHYAVQPRIEWQMVPTMRKFAELRAEIQVRTASQHIWAAASHTLQYKKETHVPPPLRRTINRVAALLETVDLEFERVLTERESYAVEMEGNGDDLVLNTESLRRVLDEVLPADNLDRDEPEEYAELVDELRSRKVLTTGQLRVLLRKHLAALLKDDKQHVQTSLREIESGIEPVGCPEHRITAGVYFTHSGLTRRAMEFEFSGKREPDRAKGAPV
jgi:putative GTP pyrophosphokinase